MTSDRDAADTIKGGPGRDHVASDDGDDVREAEMRGFLRGPVPFRRRLVIMRWIEVRRRTIPIALLPLLIVALVHPASAGTGVDGDDVPNDRVDIAKVTVRADEERNGTRIFVLAVRTYRGFRLRACRCVFAVLLDGRGDARPDLVVVTRGRTDGPRLVGVARVDEGFRHTVVVHKDRWRRFRLRIPRDWLSPTRAVWFRATARADGTTDRAPDRGRYRA